MLPLNLHRELFWRCKSKKLLKVGIHCGNTRGAELWVKLGILHWSGLWWRQNTSKPSYNVCRKCKEWEQKSRVIWIIQTNPLYFSSKRNQFYLELEWLGKASLEAQSRLATLGISRASWKSSETFHELIVSLGRACEPRALSTLTLADCLECESNFHLVLWHLFSRDIFPRWKYKTSWWGFLNGSKCWWWHTPSSCVTYGLMFYGTINV